jgi:c-di-AMP phosphodiesterase-like protein
LIKGISLLIIKKMYQHLILKRLNTYSSCEKSIEDASGAVLEEEIIDIPEFKERKTERTYELASLEKEYNELTDTTQEDEINQLNDYVKRMDVFLNKWDTLEEEDLNRGLSSFIDKVVWEYPKGAE